MSITVETAAPKALLAAIRKAIDQKHIETWHYDADGDFTHSATQWNRKAWLRPSIYGNSLALSILPPQNGAISAEVYAIYHGRFIEMLLAHFDQSFAQAYASAVPTSADIVKSAAVTG
jgi:hypothetical protein